MQQATRSSAELERERSFTMEGELASLRDTVHSLENRTKKQEEELAEATETQKQVRKFIVWTVTVCYDTSSY